MWGAAGGVDRPAPDRCSRLREIDRLASEIARTGAPSNLIELIVIDEAGEIRQWPARTERLNPVAGALHALAF